MMYGQQNVKYAYICLYVFVWFCSKVVNLHCLVFLITSSIVFDPGFYNLDEADIQIAKKMLKCNKSFVLETETICPIPYYQLSSKDENQFPLFNRTFTNL